MENIQEKLDGSKEYSVVVENGEVYSGVKTFKDIQDVLALHFNKTAQNEFKAVLKAEGENDFPFSVYIEFEGEKEGIDLDDYAITSLKDLSMSNFTFYK
ncbi:hypothetical protein ACTOJ1_001265 [Shigella flexneri]